MATSGRRGVAGGAWLIGCTGVEGTGGNVDPEGRYLAGSGPDVVDPAGEWQRRSSWSRTGDDAIRFPGRGEAEACYPRHPPTPRSARAARRTGRCPCTGSPSSTSLSACPRSRRTPGVRASWDSSTWGASPRRCPLRRRGAVPSRQAGRSSRAPPCNLRAARPLKSVIF
jgi:hypothetical protein